MLLAFDTSTSMASVALVQSSMTDTADGADARLIAELTWQVGQRHSTELLERIEWLLAASHMTMDDLTGVAVALGPGSFNGVRVALAVAKSLAFARGAPLYGVPTLDAIAWGRQAVSGTICAILEAGRGQVYAALYDATNASNAANADAANWAPRADYTIVTAAELAEQLHGLLNQQSHGDVSICGEMTPVTRETLAAALGNRAHFASPLEARRALWLAELALARAAHQRYDDAVALEPLYLRRPAITSSTRRGISAPEGADEARQREDAPEGEKSSDALRR